MKPLINLSHLCVSPSLQGLFFCVHRNLWMGAVAALFFYLDENHTSGFVSNRIRTNANMQLRW